MKFPTLFFLICTLTAAALPNGNKNQELRKDSRVRFLKRSDAPTGDINYQTPAPTRDINYQTPAPTGDINYQKPAPTGDINYQTPAPTSDINYQTLAPTSDVNYQTPAPTGDVNYQTPATTGDATYQTPADPTVEPNKDCSQYVGEPNKDCPQYTNEPKYDGPKYEEKPNEQYPKYEEKPNEHDPKYEEKPKKDDYQKEKHDNEYNDGKQHQKECSYNDVENDYKNGDACPTIPNDSYPTTKSPTSSVVYPSDDSDNQQGKKSLTVTIKVTYNGKSHNCLVSKELVVGNPPRCGENDGIDMQPSSDNTAKYCAAIRGQLSVVPGFEAASTKGALDSQLITNTGLTASEFNSSPKSNYVSVHSSLVIVLCLASSLAL